MAIVVKKTDYPLISAIIETPVVNRYDLTASCTLNLESVKTTLTSITCDANRHVGGGSSLPPMIVNWINEHAPLFVVAPRAQVTEYRIEFVNGVGSASSFIISGSQTDEQKIALYCKCAKATVPIPQKTELVRDHYWGHSGGGYPQFSPDTEYFTGNPGGKGVGPGWSQETLQNRYTVYVSTFSDSNRPNPWAWYGDRWYTRALNQAEFGQLAAYLVAHLK